MTRAPGVRTAATAAVLALAAVGGCAPAPPGSGRVPVADDVLFSQIARIPGVGAADVQYEEDFTDGSMYSGEVTAEAGADPLCVLDQVYAILWQGQEASLLVAVLQDGNDTTSRDLGVDTNQFGAGLKERYGPRPEDGAFIEPPMPPACR